MKQVVGLRPIIVGDENQAVAFLITNIASAGPTADRIHVLSPEPAIFASHPLISATETCGRLAEALADPDVQTVAWADQGLCTGMIGVEIDPAAISAARSPEIVSLVTPTPSAAAMRAVIYEMR